MKKFLIASSAAAIAMVAPATASALEVSGSASLDYVSEYVFRGVSFAGDALQPGIEVGTGGFYTGVWASIPLGANSSNGGNEVDFYAGYGFDVAESISADLGLTYYHFPQSGSFLSDNNGAGSYEVYGGLSFDTVLAPSVYAYYDFTLEAFTLEGSVGHSFPVSEALSLDLGLTAGLCQTSASDLGCGAGDDYEYATGSAAISFPIGGAVGGYVGANYSVSSEDTLDSTGTPTDNFFWFGTGIAADF